MFDPASLADDQEASQRPMDDEQLEQDLFGDEQEPPEEDEEGENLFGDDMERYE